MGGGSPVALLEWRGVLENKKLLWGFRWRGRRHEKFLSIVMGQNFGKI